MRKVITREGISILHTSLKLDVGEGVDLARNKWPERKDGRVE